MKLLHIVIYEYEAKWPIGGIASAHQESSKAVHDYDNGGS